MLKLQGTRKTTVMCAICVIAIDSLKLHVSKLKTFFDLINSTEPYFKLANKVCQIVFKDLRLLKSLNDVKDLNNVCLYV